MKTMKELGWFDPIVKPAKEATVAGVAMAGQILPCWECGHYLTLWGIGQAGWDLLECVACECVVTRADYFKRKDYPRAE